jgi:hypothetical protein
MTAANGSERGAALGEAVPRARARARGGFVRSPRRVGRSTRHRTWRFRQQFACDAAQGRDRHEPLPADPWRRAAGVRELDLRNRQTSGNAVSPGRSRGVCKAGSPQRAFSRAREFAIVEANRRGAAIVRLVP